MLIVIPYGAAGCMVAPLAVATCSAKVSGRADTLGKGTEARTTIASRTARNLHPSTRLDQYDIDIQQAVGLQLV